MGLRLARSCGSHGLPPPGVRGDSRFEQKQVPRPRAAGPVIRRPHTPQWVRVKPKRFADDAACARRALAAAGLTV